MFNQQLTGLDIHVFRQSGADSGRHLCRFGCFRKRGCVIAVIYLGIVQPSVRIILHKQSGIGATGVNRCSENRLCIGRLSPDWCCIIEGIGHGCDRWQGFGQSSCDILRKTWELQADGFGVISQHRGAPARAGEPNHPVTFRSTHHAEVFEGL